MFYILSKILIGGNNMVALYVALIIAGRRTFNQVPAKFKAAVKADLEALGLHRFQFIALCSSLHLHLFACSEFFGRSDPDHVAILAHVEALLLHDDIQRLIPGHVLENQGDLATNGVADDHVHASEFADHLQQTADLDILEIE